MRALLAQLEPTPGDVAANVETACSVIAGADADLVVFPELYLSGYDLAGIEQLAVEPTGPELRALQAAARDAGSGVVLGATERLGTSRFANSAFCLGPDGHLVATYRKTHLFGAEREAFEPGTELVVAEIGATRLGIEICFDVEFPEVSRSLAQADIDVLVVISANFEPFARDHEVFTAARALENEMPLVYVNRVGREAGLAFVGDSCVIGPEARASVRLGPDPALVEIDVPVRGRQDPRTRYLGQLRPELYEDHRRALPSD